MIQITKKAREYLEKVGRLGGLVAGGETDFEAPEKVPKDFQTFAAAIGHLGGLARTKEKKEAARENGKKGGRPSVKNPSYHTLRKRESRIEHRKINEEEAEFKKMKEDERKKK